MTTAVELTRSRALLEQASQHARIAQTTGDARAETRWREVAGYWRTRTLTLQREVDQSATNGIAAVGITLRSIRLPRRA